MTKDKKTDEGLKKIQQVLKGIETGKIKLEEEPDRELTEKEKAQINGWVKEVREAWKRRKRAEKRMGILLDIFKEAQKSKKSSKAKPKTRRPVRGEGR